MKPRLVDQNKSDTRDYWLVKQEPEDYPWTAFVQDGTTAWTGVRNYTARLNLRAMKRGDHVLYYHSGISKEVVGLAEVVKTAYPDPTKTPDEKGDWVAVDLRVVRPLKQAVTLKVIKADPALAGIALVRNSRLSVMPLQQKEFQRILELSETA